MPNSKERSLKKFSFIFLIPILLLGFFIFSSNASETNHLVISAIQITEGEGKTNHDFIEIYNPTSGDINLKGYRLVKRTKIGTSDTSIKSWTDDAIIKAHGWRLWASSDDTAFSSSLGADDFTKQTIAADNGIAIRFGAADTGEIIDSVAWGEASNAFNEGNIPANPAASEALVRKPGNGNGNGEDTNNNANDFNITSSFVLHNSSSPAQPAVSGTSDNNSGSNANSGSSGNTSSPPPSPISVSQPNAPIAEAGDDQIAVIGEAIIFDGSDSYDQSGKDLSFSWDFGDGKTGKGENAYHAYDSAGEFIVVLKVNNGTAIGEDSSKIKVSEPEFSDKIVLSEILPDPKGADKDGEWIELANTGDKKINLLGWILDDAADAGGKSYVFAEDIFIEPQDFLVIKRLESKIVLPNKGGEVNLLWYDGKILSKVSYDSAKEGKSYALIDGVWQWTANPTPGKDNALAEPPAKAASKEVSIETVAETGGEKDDTADIIADENMGSDIEDAEESTILDEGAVQAEKLEDAINSGEEEKNKSSEKSGSVINGKNLVAGELAAFSGSVSEQQQPVKNGNNTKNNPWFWGDMALSVLSLFLVWRYQELRKAVK